MSYQGHTPQAQKTAAYRTGDRIGGRYEIQGIFGGEGKSAMGVVYQCYDHEHARVLALKTLQDKYLSSKKIQDSFKKEALAWIHLEKHPNIVRAFWVRELDQRMFVACEFIMPDGAGRNMLTHYFKSAVTLRQALIWALQFSDGMEYACKRGVTPHRDIKPDNIMISYDNVLMITDFGLVGLWNKAENTEEVKRIMKNRSESMTFLATENNRFVAGSPPWMSPEQFYGVAETRSDLYGFGVTFYQLLAGGRLPFQPKGKDTWALAHKNYPVPPLQGRGKPVEGILRRCLEKRRENRYSGFRELREELEKVFRKEITKETGEEPPEPPETERLENAGLINKGLSLANLGLVDEGIRQYREGLRKDPQNAAAHYNLGNALSQKGRDSEAIDAYQKALGIDRSFAPAHYNLAIVLFRLGRLDEAIRSFQNVIRIKPDFAEAYANLGNAFMRKGMIDKAIDAYGKAVNINPAIGDVYQKLGNALMQKGLLPEAIRAFQESARAFPDRAESHCQLGIALSKGNRLDEAIQAFGKALMLKADHADAYYGIGFSFLNKDLLREALQAFEGFLRCAPSGDKRRARAEELCAKIKGTMQNG